MEKVWPGLSSGSIHIDSKVDAMMQDNPNNAVQHVRAQVFNFINIRAGN